MKKAVIVVGSHYAGKSKAIRMYLKPLLKISRFAHKFKLRGKDGFILSQSFEEAGRDVKATIKKYRDYDLLVFAARPRVESGSKFNELRKELLKASFNVKAVTIQKKEEAPKKAKEIFAILKS